MLSAPVKSARRISSLLNLGSSSKQPSDQTTSPDLPPQNTGRARSSSRPARHASSPLPQSPASRPKTSSGPVEPLDLNDLPPPPSLLAVNQALSDSGSNSRPGSRGASGSRPSSSAGLTPHTLAPSFQPGTPGERAGKRRSWMPGKSRSPSVEMRNHEYEAWVAGLDQKIPYDLGPLVRGEAVRTLTGLTGLAVPR